MTRNKPSLVVFDIVGRKTTLVNIPMCFSKLVAGKENGH